jgi:hypothetical protein
MGLGEHASIAAFARLVLDLLSMGAPPELLADTARALEDEIEHARLCFSIASGFNGGWASPGRLDLSDVLGDDVEPASILEGAILEGCFVETISARWAQATYERAKVPRIHKCLERIAGDESRHADLSWRLVEWMLEAYPALHSQADDAFSRGFKEMQREVLSSEGDDVYVEQFGQLTEQSQQAIAERTMREVVKPRADALLGTIAHSPR